jgi:hypothetical protein
MRCLDGLLTVGSETGMAELGDHQVVQRGAMGRGMIAGGLAEGGFYAKRKCSISWPRQASI